MSHTDSDVEELPYDYVLNAEQGEEEETLEIETEYDQIVYRSEDFISTSYFSDKCTFTSDILEFDFSYGYDCKRHFNLLVADEQTLVFASGNFLNFFNTETKEIWFRRSALGGGIGHLTTNPNRDYSHITIAENGPNPPIIIYNWPTLDIVTVLKGGSAATYTHISYSPNGSLLVSQSGDPDYLITVWNWTKSRILLRTKSYSNDVYKVMFSPTVPGHLTSCGVAHIKFWKMAKTFTGLKLQGELGRFGKTEYSDILGIYPMPDEKVVSGCYWGNILVWDEGLIKLEVFRKHRKNCHGGPIVQFDFKNGQLWTVSMDGSVKVWMYEPVDQADPPDDDRVVLIEPVYEFPTPGVQFMYIIKQNPVDEGCTLYYAQDGNGGLWRIDLNTEADVRPSEQLYKCHAGKVMDIAVCPWGHYLASLGEDGRIYVYNYMTRLLIFHHQFPAKGRAMIWIPINIQDSGDQLILAFDDGNLRVIGLNINEFSDEIKLFLLQVTKPHNKPITQMTLNVQERLVVTAGEDKTIFIFTMFSKEDAHTTLIPIGYIHIPDIASCLAWHCTQPHTLIVGCVHGDLMQVELPKNPQPYTTITYILRSNPVYNRFVTYKSQIRRDIHIRAIEEKKEAKRERKRKEMRKILAENPGMTIDEEIYLADSESTETLTPLFIPEIPNKVLWIQSLPNDRLWLSMGGYDAGYVYEYSMDLHGGVPHDFRMVYEADDIEISSYIYNYNKRYLIMAMQDGSIRVNRVNDEDYMDLSDYWKLSMHDNLNGFVPRMIFSFDEKYFFSCGHDGNVFSYQFFPENDDYIEDYPKRANIFHEEQYLSVKEDEKNNYHTLSLEEAIVKAERDRVEALANKRKAILRQKLAELGYNFTVLIERNEKLLPTQTIPKHFFQLDKRINKDLKKRMDANLALVKRKLQFQVEKSKLGMQKMLAHFIDPLDAFPISVKGISSQTVVRSVMQRRLCDDFDSMLELVEQKLIEAELKGRPPERPMVKAEAQVLEKKDDGKVEYFLLGLSPSTIKYKLGAKLTRLLARYRERKRRRERRKEEWEAFKKQKPIPGVNHPDDEAEVLTAIQTIGDYKLKTALDYKIPAAMRDTTVKKYKELLQCRERQFNMRHEFNDKVYEMRDRKVMIVKELERLKKILAKIHKELKDDQKREAPDIPEISPDDFPEENIEIKVEYPQKTVSEMAVHQMRFYELVLPPDEDQFERDMLAPINDKFSVWEVECRQLRLVRKLYEQDRIIDEIEKLLKEFDEDLEELAEERIRLAVDCSFIDIHLLKLHQELIILKDFEAGEDILQDKVNERTEDYLDRKMHIDEIKNTIKSYEDEIVTLHEREKKIVNEFFGAVNDNKFFDFLRKIFKKKYKPPKVHDPDDEDESSSSESSDDSDEEEDEGSIDSRDFGIIKLDESVCPKGCDQTLFDLTYTLRGQRHQVELKIRDLTDKIGDLKKSIESENKKLKQTEAQVKVCQDELEVYQREKQKRLNTVTTTVILKLHQIQNLRKDKDFAINKISDSLVFSQPSLTKLYKRVGQLQTETIKQRAKHKLNITHLGRMKADCKYMSKDIAKLKKDIEEAMIIKFGRVVDIDEIEEANLRKMVFYLRMRNTDIRSLFEHELTLWRKRYDNKQIELGKTIKENTERLELLTVLNKERADLAQLVFHQNAKREQLDNLVNVAENFKHDISKLSAIVSEQNKEILLLKNEIKTLRSKGLSLKDLEVPDLSRPQEIQEEEDEDFGLDWGGTFEEYLEQNWEYYAAMEEEKRKRDEDLMTKAKLDILMQKPDERQPIVKKFRPKHAEEYAMEIIEEMLNEIDVKAVRLRIESMLSTLVNSIMACSCVKEILEQLINLLPVDSYERFSSIIELTAEKLYAINLKKEEQELEQEQEEPSLTEEDILGCVKDIIEEIMDLTVTGKAGTLLAISDLVKNIVYELPLEFLTQKEIINLIMKRLTSDLSFVEINKDDLSASLSSLKGPLAHEMRSVLNLILEKVFGIGIDYLYILNERYLKKEIPEDHIFTFQSKELVQESKQDEEKTKIQEVQEEEEEEPVKIKQEPLESLEDLVICVKEEKQEDDKILEQEQEQDGEEQ